MTQPCPPGLGSGGSELWSGVAKGGELDPVQLVNLLEACRQKDRLDKLDEMLRGDVTLWARLTHRTEDYELVIDRGFASALAAANQMKQHLAALRLPDSWGDRPQKRGGARGAYAPSGAEPSEQVRDSGSSRKRLKVVGSAG